MPQLTCRSFSKDLLTACDIDVASDAVENPSLDVLLIVIGL